jgi:hypothetical protein
VALRYMPAKHPCVDPQSLDLHRFRRASAQVLSILSAGRSAAKHPNRRFPVVVRIIKSG